MKAISAVLGAFTSLAVLCANISVPAVWAEDPQEISVKELFDCAKGIISWEKEYAGTAEDNSLFSGDFLENAGQESADWFVIGASRLGLQEDYASYSEALAENVAERYESCGGLDENKATEWHRIILAVCACGEDPADFSGTNLISDGIYGRSEEKSLGRQGLNGWIWGLTALDSICWKTPEECTFDREYIISQILSAQLSDGGFAVSGDKGETDLTAMAVTALSPYINNGSSDTARKAVDKALNFLSGAQLSDGGFGNCEATAQVLCALCSSGVDFKSDERFIKDGATVYNALLGYRNEDGGFSHEAGGESSAMPSAQALLAFAAVTRYENTMRRLYDFREEFSVSDREKLNAVKGQMLRIDGDEDKANQCNTLYRQLSADMQSYVYGYGEILKLKDKFGLSLSDSSFTDEMSINENAKGYIYDVENDKEFSFEVPLTEAEINSINAEIMAELYPFEKLSAKQREKAEEIYSRVMQLSEKDRQKITGYEELCDIHHNKDVKKTLAICILSAAVIAAGAVLIIRAKRKKTTEE